MWEHVGGICSPHEKPQIQELWQSFSLLLSLLRELSRDRAGEGASADATGHKMATGGSQDGWLVSLRLPYSATGEPGLPALSQDHGFNNRKTGGRISEM